MSNDYDGSLGDENTFAGGARGAAPQSLGDELTMSGADRSMHTAFDDGMEIVDLSARYTVEETLGKGGMGEVLLATDTRLNRKVAIKRMLGEASKSRTAIGRFLTEAKSIATLNHPNIVQIYDYGRDKDGPFLIMEYVDGGSLLERCRDGTLPLEEAVELTCQLCEGLGKAHIAGIIHRDIKPANILLTKDGIPKLTDFGLAKAEAADTSMTMAGAVLGTLDFMPPEQRRDAALTDARSDLWSLAATLYQIVTGKSPRIIKFNNVPKSLQDVLGKALEDEKEDRYQTAGEFHVALRESLGMVAPEAAFELNLGAGECLKCHTKNDSSRKYCRKCAAPLRVKCLACGHDIPVWDKVCAECGGKQTELLAVRLNDLATLRGKAESLRQAYAFAEAGRIAHEINSIKDLRLQQLKSWSANFIATTGEEKEQYEQSASRKFKEAQMHREAYDYQSAIQAIETVPEAMRSEEMQSFFHQLESDHEESQQVIRTISDRIKRRDLEGLLERVNSALELVGDRADLRKLQIQLTERRDKLLAQRDEAYTAAKELLSQGQAKQALTKVQAVVTTELRDSDIRLSERLQQIVIAENEFAALLKKCNADGILDPDEVVELLKSADDYLQLNPSHEKINAIKEQLCNRIRLAPARYPSHLLQSVSHLLTLETFKSLPPSVIAEFPVKILVKLPPDVLNKLPIQALAALPIDLLKNLFSNSQNRLAPEVSAKLPTEVLAKLPTECWPNCLARCLRRCR